jgi:hypothetical protein
MGHIPLSIWDFHSSIFGDSVFCHVIVNESVFSNILKEQNALTFKGQGVSEMKKH